MNEIPAFPVDSFLCCILGTEDAKLYMYAEIFLSVIVCLKSFFEFF